MLAFLIHVNSLMYFEKPSGRPEWPVEQQPWGINGASGGIQCPLKTATLHDGIVLFVIRAEACRVYMSALFSFSLLPVEGGENKA